MYAQYEINTAERKYQEDRAEKARQAKSVQPKQPRRISTAVIATIAQWIIR